MNPFERSALNCAEHGFRVFPVRPRAKRPIEKGWQRKATTNPTLISETWRKYPEANVGVAMGGGLFALDTDSADAEQALAV